MTKRKTFLLKAIPKGERAVLKLLKLHPEIIWESFFRNDGLGYLVQEFELGNEHRADFVSMRGFSGGWEIDFIELESPNVQLFNKDRTPKKELKHAIRQIDDWKLFEKKQKSYLLTQLSNAAKKRDLFQIQRRNDQDPTDSVGWLMTDPRSTILCNYHIIIGKRVDFFSETYELKNHYKKDHGMEIASYDRLVEAAVRCDKNHALWT